MRSTTGPTNESQQPRTAAYSPAERALHVRPWVRFFARNIDIIILSFVVGLLIAYFHPVIINTSNLIISMGVLFIWMLLEPIFLCTFGTTFGKWLLRVQVTDLKMQKLSFVAALKRSSLVWFFGFGIGIPLLSLITLIWSYARLERHGATVWDENKCIVTHGKIGLVRTLIAIAIFVATIGFSVYSAYQLQNAFSTASVARQIEGLNKDLPMLVDEQTKLMRVLFDGKVVEYQYMLVNTNVKDMRVEIFTGAMQSAITNEVCATPYSRNLLAHGYTLSYSYADRNGEPVTDIKLNRSDCE